MPQLPTPGRQIRCALKQIFFIQERKYNFTSIRQFSQAHLGHLTLLMKAKLETVQHRTMKMIPSLCNKSYEEKQARCCNG